MYGYSRARRFSHSESLRAFEDIQIHDLAIMQDGKIHGLVELCS
jgi:hypothetical protein